jgi:hypothetical protein
MPSSELMKARAEVVANDLVGTCKSIHEVCEDGEENDITFCQELDDRVFCCTGCSWWSDVSDLGKDKNGELYCDECSPEDEDDDGDSDIDSQRG